MLDVEASAKEYLKDELSKIEKLESTGRIKIHPTKGDPRS
jgi:hypothetical protein